LDHPRYERSSGDLPCECDIWAEADERRSRRRGIKILAAAVLTAFGVLAALLLR
jgi:hypothetical protein